MRKDLSPLLNSPSLRAQRSNPRRGAHGDGDCRVAALLAMTGKLTQSAFTRDGRVTGSSGRAGLRLQPDQLEDPEWRHWRCGDAREVLGREQRLRGEVRMP